MDFFFNNIFQEIISLSIDLCLVIHNIGSKHDRETIAFKLTFTLLTLHTSLLQEMSVNFWAFFDTQLMNFIWIFSLQVYCASGSAPKYLVRAVVCQWVKNSHVQFRFVDF